MAGGLIGGLFIGLTLTLFASAPIGISKLRKSHLKKKQKKEVEIEAQKMMSLWGTSIENAGHDDKVLFMLLYFIRTQQKNSVSYSVLIDDLACAELIMASCVIYENKSNDSFEEKMNIVFEKILCISNLSKELIKDRMMFYRRVYFKSGKEALKEEVILIIPHDHKNKILAEYDEKSPLMLIEYDESIRLKSVVYPTFLAMEELIDSELGRA